MTNTFASGPNPVGAATREESIDPGDDLSHDDDTTYMGHGSGVVSKEVSYRHDVTFAERMAAINSVTLYDRSKRTDSSTDNHFLKVTLGGSSNTSSSLALTTSYATYSYDVTSLRPAGGSWSEEDLRDTTFEFGYLTSTNSPTSRITSMWVAVDYVPSATKIEPVRRVLSRRLRLLRQPTTTFTIEVKHESGDTESSALLDAYPGDIVAVSHFAIPHASNTGASVGVKSWQRRNCIVLRNEFNPASMTARLTLLDARHFWHGLWDVAVSSISSTSQRDGIASLDAGATRTFLRDSSAWGPDPGDGRIVQVASQTEKNFADGHLIEQTITNHTLNSCFTDGIDSGDWTLEGEGVNGSALNDDTSDTFWDTDETAQSCQMIGGSPLGGTDLGFKETTGTISANTVCCISTTHKDDSGDALTIEITRAVDSWYYNAVTPGWQSGAADNDLTVRSSATRDAIKNIDVGGTNTTITYKVKVNTTAAQENHVYDVQFEENPYPTSRILTQSATVTRADDEFYYSNTKSNRTWYPTRGTAFAIVQPEWDTGDLPTGSKRTLYYVQYDANNEDHVYYDEADGAWKFDRKIGGITCSASKTETLTAGTQYKIAARWTSTEGEENLSVARDLDGSNDYYLRGADLTGNADDKSGIIVARIRIDGGDAALQSILRSHGTNFSFQRMASDKLQVFGKNSGGTEILNLQSTTSYTTSTSWIDVMASWNLAVTTTHFYVDGVDDANEVTATNDTIDYTRSDYGVGANVAAGDKFNGAIAWLYFAPGQYLDLSTAANRLKFRKADGTPEDLGIDGSTPTGTAPLVYLPDGDASNNHGTGGNFTATGSPDATTGPAPAPTISIFVDGTKGTDDSTAHSTGPDEAALLQIGRKSADTNMLDGFVQHLYVTPQVLTDNEIARLP
jgi:hypothetical protein